MTRWDESPLGAWCGVLVAESDGRRTLFVESGLHADDVARLHDLDRVVLARVDVVASQRRWCVRVEATDPVDLTVDIGSATIRGRAVARLPRRVVETPAFAVFTELVLRVGAPVVRSWRRIHAAGRLRDGQAEFHCARSEHRITAVRGTINGHDIGTLDDVGSCGFGFSDPPATPAVGAMTAMRRRPRPARG